MTKINFFLKIGILFFCLHSKQNSKITEMELKLLFFKLIVRHKVKIF